ncbi:MAG: sigma-54-dependent Fis family transcriptional regulator [Candidatus Cloacimonetes bacterium]|nr:sigma-54-dependent Fis family transcriptional regulator [Candidatus Cloacimonadota bacterium]
MKHHYKILIVDDDNLLQNSLKNILSDKYETLIASTGEDALQILSEHSVDLILLDIRLPGIDGIETLKLILERDKDLPVIMMTAYEDIKTVIISMKIGAQDYLVKPLDIDELELVIEKALDNLKLKKELEELRKQCVIEFGIDNIIGESEGIKEALALSRKVAKSNNTTVLIEGETGTGKEVIAKAIHYHSTRIGKPFISINCGAINKDLLESELFGYEKGAFTGGLKEGKKGKFELADEGTLLLDEISELAFPAQVQLLRVLEEREFYPVGGTEERKVDVRVIAATNKNLINLVNEGIFREDLYYRLNVVKILLPPLRDRKEDIIPLALFFMKNFNEKFGKKFQHLSKDAETILLNYHWPGNVRELRNVIERILLMEDDNVISLEYLRFLNFDVTPPAEASPDFMISPSGIDLEDLNKQLIIQALELSGGNKTKAAQLLGISRATMIYRIGKYGIDM